jgi:hypothetical protein
MKFDIGIVAAVVGALIFYTRLTWVQRRVARSQAKSPGGARKVNPIKNWTFFALGICLVCVGAVFAALNLSPLLRTYWWIPVTLGFGALCFAV